MKKARIPLLIAIGVCLIGIILGSFLDVKISQGLGASPSSGFGLGVSVVVPTLGFLALSLFGGGYCALAFKKESKAWVRVVFGVLALACYGASVYFAGEEFFGPNGFASAAPKFVGYLISALPLAGAVYLGYRLTRNSENPYVWVYLTIGIVAIFIALVPGTTVLKSIFHRPRYRAILASEGGIVFHNWWQPCRDYKSLMESFGMTSEEFKSFPSGHSCEAAMLFAPVTFFPMINEKLRKYQMWGFVCAGLIVILTWFARMTAAAHFLSDVSMGALLMILFICIGNEVVVHSKRFGIEKKEE